jgi:hypothetical protein
MKNSKDPFSEDGIWYVTAKDRYKDVDYYGPYDKLSTANGVVTQLKQEWRKLTCVKIIHCAVIKYEEKNDGES